MNDNKISKEEMENKEAEEHNKGCLGSILLSIIWLIVLYISCVIGSGWLIIPILGLLVPIFIFVGKALGNRSRDKIDSEKALAEQRAKTLANKIKAGESTTELINEYSGYKSVAEKESQKKETKQIIKGAVIGEIIAGDVGGVVGATIAKNKIDKNKK